MTDHGHERYEALLMKRVDGFIRPDEQTELDRHVQSCATCRQELEEFVGIKDTTDRMRDRLLADVARDPLRPDLPTRWIDRLGFVVLIAVCVILLGFGAWTTWQDPKIPALIRWTLLAGGGTATLVFLNILRLRLGAAPTDQYREIDR